MLTMPGKGAVLALPSDLQDPIWRQMKPLPRGGALEIVFAGLMSRFELAGGARP